MNIKSLNHYYNLPNQLRDGDNVYIQKYTSKGFIKARDRWKKYSHNSYLDFFHDFEKDYNDDFLNRNCDECLQEMRNTGSLIDRDVLFDVLLRRLVFDTFIGFKAEEIIELELNRNNVCTSSTNVLSEKDIITLDIAYNVDIITYKNNSISHLIQVKNTSTFAHDGSYIKSKRVQFFEREKMANDFINDGHYRKIIYYIYDKRAFIDTECFYFYVNPQSDKITFTLDELVNYDGSLKLNIKNLKRRKIN